MFDAAATRDDDDDDDDDDAAADFTEDVDDARRFCSATGAATGSIARSREDRTSSLANTR